MEVKQEPKLEVKQEPIDPIDLSEDQVVEQELQAGDDNGSVTEFPESENAAVRILHARGKDTKFLSARRGHTHTHTHTRHDAFTGRAWRRR
jgi:hypothetical protein